jgi:hypothetical protein
MDTMSVAEIERQYPDEWVLVEITRDHRQHRKVVGRLLAHSPDPDGLDEAYQLVRAERPRAHLFQFFTGALVAEGFSAVL